MLAVDVNFKFKDHISKLKLLSMASRAPSTVQNYTGGFRRWKKWCVNMDISHFPANPVHVALYLMFIMESKDSYHAVKNASYSIDWAHKIAGLEVPSQHPMVLAVKESSARIYGQPVIKKEPITPVMLNDLVSRYFRIHHPSLYHARPVALCLIAYAGFLRYDELSSLLCLDVTFHPGYIMIFTESSKTDQYRDAAWLPISGSSFITCRLKALNLYADMAGIDFESDLPLFRGLNSVKAKTRMRKSKISYTRVRELVKEAFADSIDVNLIGVHSLRAGGASSAANNGIPDRLFKRHGRW